MRCASMRRGGGGYPPPRPRVSSPTQIEHPNLPPLNLYSHHPRKTATLSRNYRNALEKYGCWTIKGNFSNLIWSKSIWKRTLVYSWDCPLRFLEHFNRDSLSRFLQFKFKCILFAPDAQWLCRFCWSQFDCIPFWMFSDNNNNYLYKFKF